jgi:hypothetical protein
MSANYLHKGDPDWGWEFRAEDFVLARLDQERAAADELTGADLEAVHNRVASLKRIVAWHSTYVDRDGRSHARCFTCEPSHGFPCTTMRNLASIWRDHPDFVSAWLDEGTFLADVFAAGTFRNAFLVAKESA